MENPLKKILFILATVSLVGCASDQDALEACQDKADAWKLRATLDLHHVLEQPSMQHAGWQTPSNPKTAATLNDEAARQIDKAYAQKAAMCEESEQQTPSA